MAADAADAAEGMGDEVYQPTGSDTPDNPDDLDLENELDERGGGGLDNMLDEGYSPPEKPLAVTKHGTTAREQREGETLDERLREEEPDVGEQIPLGDGIGDQPGMEGEPIDEDQVGDERAGRLAEPITGEAMAGVDVGIDGGAAGAEEAAMHVIDENPDEMEPPTGSRR
ncbi:DUF5709 domain-containing protein [Streptomyces alkaliphilus]|uniref:DUF5709 domain-containing protein n=1 Tax=Streptomyces alkaliphilus TaxID=1472722 RepID=UPI0011804813|nr:DUF5709 domain-containing protein [Streptomyces alkaliphilus]MQS07145.1 hypothetical protein [Streptomyces alkaliphilus]